MENEYLCDHGEYEGCVTCARKAARIAGLREGSQMMQALAGSEQDNADLYNTYMFCAERLEARADAVEKGTE